MKKYEEFITDQSISFFLKELESYIISNKIEPSDENISLILNEAVGGFSGRITSDTCHCKNCNQELHLTEKDSKPEDKHICFHYNSHYGYKSDQEVATLKDKDEMFNHLLPEQDGNRIQDSAGIQLLKNDWNRVGTIGTSITKFLAKKKEEEKNNTNKINAINAENEKKPDGTPKAKSTEELTKTSGTTNTGITGGYQLKGFLKTLGDKMPVFSKISDGIKNQIWHAFMINIKGYVYCNPVCKWDFCHSDRDLSYAVPVPDCPICGGYGYIEEKPTNKYTKASPKQKKGYKPCDCMKKKNLSSHKKQNPRYKDEDQAKEKREYQCNKLISALSNKKESY